MTLDVAPAILQFAMKSKAANTSHSCINKALKFCREIIKLTPGNSCQERKNCRATSLFSLK